MIGDIFHVKDKVVILNQAGTTSLRLHIFKTVNCLPLMRMTVFKLDRHANAGVLVHVDPSAGHVLGVLPNRFHDCPCHRSPFHKSFQVS